MIRTLLKRTEFYIAVVIVALCVFIQIQSGQFFTNNNIVDLLRSLIVPGMLAVGTFIVIVSGGIDISFTAVALLSMYATTMVLRSIHFSGSIVIPFLMSSGIGLFLGMINATLIGLYEFPTLIVTLGTSSIFLGFMQGILRARRISDLPQPMIDFGRINLITVHNGNLNITSGLPITFLLLVAMILIAWLVLQFTILGRGIYAIGGDRISAKRVGFNVIAIQFFIYGFVGVVSGLAGITRVILLVNAEPTSLIGMELTVIAAVVLGGTRISGGHGTLTGMVLGLTLVTIMNTSLILMGIPTYWQQFATGALIIIGTGVSAYQAGVPAIGRARSERPGRRRIAPPTD